MDSAFIGILLVGGGVIAAGLGLAITRRLVPSPALDSHHEVAGFIFGTVGVIYAVLLAFVVVAVWEQFEAAKTAVSEEGNHLGNIVRLAEGLKQDETARILSGAKEYARTVIEHEWPAMESGDTREVAHSSADNLWKVIRDFNPATEREQVLYAEMINQMDELGGDRRSRLHASYDDLPNLMWVLLIGGGITTVAFTYFFRVKGLTTQLLMTSALAGITVFVLFLILALDNPFRGSVSVSPEPIEFVLQRLP
ncbi:MAG: DUF4239 domain-containing protein [Acidobacteriota bacterium]